MKENGFALCDLFRRTIQHLSENICQTCIFLTFNFHLMNGYYHLKALLPFHAQLNMGTNDNEN